MASILENRERCLFSIPDYETKDNVTIYNVKIDIGDYSWNVKHRYKDFVELHERLVADHCVSKDILPPKKLVGNRSKEFIEQRKIGLEIYLKTVVGFLQKSLPHVLVRFLNLHQYDVYYHLENFTNFCFTEGDAYLERCTIYSFSPLLLHAITRRLSEDNPPDGQCEGWYEFSHVLDFCRRINSLTIRGESSFVGDSNIPVNKLKFGLSVFKNVNKLYLYNIDPHMITNLGTLRQTAITVIMYNCRIQSLSEILLCDAVHKDTNNMDQEYNWEMITELDLSWNEIREIDSSVKLMPKLQRLTIDGNIIRSINHINLLPNLTYLSLSANKISVEEDLFEELQYVKHLKLSQNKITKLSPFHNLSSLNELNLAANYVNDFNEIKFICHLPNITNLVLTGNPVATVIDYRVKIFEYFNKQSENLCLDNERPSQKELDRAAVLRALTIVREGKEVGAN